MLFVKQYKIDNTAIHRSSKLRKITDNFTCLKVRKNFCDRL